MARCRQPLILIYEKFIVTSSSRQFCSVSNSPLLVVPNGQCAPYLSASPHVAVYSRWMHVSASCGVDESKNAKNEKHTSVAADEESATSDTPSGSKRKLLVKIITPGMKEKAEKEQRERLESMARERNISEIQMIKMIRAKKQYNLTAEHLADLPQRTARSAYIGEPANKMLYERDVMQRAAEIHGSVEAVARLLRISAEFTHADDSQTHDPDASYVDQQRQREGPNTGLRSESGKVVLTAIAMNSLDCVFKYGGWYMTGSKSMFAEAIHSSADLFNQCVLSVGVSYASSAPNPKYPYGFGNLRYVSSLISGVGIFFIGCGVSMYHGIDGILHPHELEPLTYAYYALAASFVFQSVSASRAFMSLRSKVKIENQRLGPSNKMTVTQYIMESRDPSVNVVLLEDCAAMTGVMIALTAITASSITGNPIYDSLGSCAIGTLLGGVAAFVIKANSMHLVGQSIPHGQRSLLVKLLESDPTITSAHDVKATYMGPDATRLKAELKFNGREITQAYLDGKDVHSMLLVAQRLKNEAQLREFLADHGEGVIDQLGLEVDRLECQIKEVDPTIRHIDLEAL